MVVATDEETGTQRVQLQKCGADGAPLGLPEGIPSPVIAGQQVRRPTTISAAHQRVAAAWTADDGGVISLVVVQRCY